MDGLPGLVGDPSRRLAEWKLVHDRSRSQQLFDFFNAQVVGSWNHTNEHYSLSMPQPTDRVCNPLLKTATMGARIFPNSSWTGFLGAGRPEKEARHHRHNIALVR